MLNLHNGLPTLTEHVTFHFISCNKSFVEISYFAQFFEHFICFHVNFRSIHSLFQIHWLVVIQSICDLALLKPYEIFRQRTNLNCENPSNAFVNFCSHKMHNMHCICLICPSHYSAISSEIKFPLTFKACVVVLFFLKTFFFFKLNANFVNINRDFRPTTLGKKQEKIRLRVYKTYAWGFPFVITAIAAIMDNLPDSHDVLRPKFGEKTCWFVGKWFIKASNGILRRINMTQKKKRAENGEVESIVNIGISTSSILGDMEIFVYFFGPIGLLLFINICLFASTTRQLMCGLWKQDDVKSSTER